MCFFTNSIFFAMSFFFAYIFCRLYRSLFLIWGRRTVQSFLLLYTLRIPSVPQRQARCELYLLVVERNFVRSFFFKHAVKLGINEFDGLFAQVELVKPEKGVSVRFNNFTPFNMCIGIKLGVV